MRLAGDDGLSECPPWAESCPLLTHSIGGWSVIEEAFLLHRRCGDGVVSSEYFINIERQRVVRRTEVLSRSVVVFMLYDSGNIQKN